MSRLEVVEGSDAGRTFELREKNLIGRGADSNTARVHAMPSVIGSNTPLSSVVKAVWS